MVYSETHGTFEAYCRERWSMTDRRARQLMITAEVASYLNKSLNKTGTMVPVPANERQARPLAELPKPDRDAAHQLVQAADVMVTMVNKHQATNAGTGRLTG